MSLDRALRRASHWLGAALDGSPPPPFPPPPPDHAGLARARLRDAPLDAADIAAASRIGQRAASALVASLPPAAADELVVPPSTRRELDVAGSSRTDVRARQTAGSPGSTSITSPVDP